MSDSGNGAAAAADGLELRIARIERRQDHHEAVTLADMRGLETLIRQVQRDIAEAHIEAMGAIHALSKITKRRKARRK